MARPAAERPRRGLFSALVVGVLALGFGLAGAAPAVAQRIPGTADPFRLLRQFRPTPTPTESAPPIRIEEPAPVTVPEGVDVEHLQLTEITIEGSTVYQRAELEPLWHDLLEREVALSELYGVATKITAKYRNDGYVLSRAIVPAQLIENGVVRLEVIEGYIGKITIDGQVSRESLLTGYADKIMAMRPLRMAELERYLLLFDDLAGATAESVLSPLEGEPGAAVLTIEMRQKVVDAFATMDNRGTRYLGPFQTSIGGRLNSALGFYEQTQLRLISTPEYFNELRGYDLTHSIPVDTEGTLLSLEINQAFAHPGFTLKPLRVDSTVTVVSASLVHPLIRQRAENLQVQVGLSASDLRTDLFDGTTPLLNDRLRSVALGALYDFVDGSNGINVFAATLSHGLDILGARTSGSPNLSRASGRSDFTKLTTDAQHIQSLGGDFSVLLAATGQYGATSLLASEQFNLGGASYLRAYDPSELAGDSGVAGKLELQFGRKPDAWWLNSYQLYGYYEIGRVWNRAPGAGERAAASATAVGIGARLVITENISASLELAKPLARPVATEGDKDPRVFFGLVARF
ncbi:MAG: ShlB/FhaC/HecB family hemolysin secretion/activation protein [Alphaproteobacteria bacterium]|nr:ShlB/FhaC/HecB family hemolysin secretion/activation protein [Alphaproteobacteria bacterium]